MVTEIRATGRPYHRDATSTLQARLRGQLILPGSEVYESARKVWDGNVDKRPAAIVRAADVIDVMAAVEYANELKLPIAVRSGGHSLAGYGTTNEGIAIDLSLMNAISIDPARRVAWVQTGANWGEYAEAAQVHGLATSSGDTASVGVGGLTTGGGIGWMVRKHGLAIDHLISAEVVTADGRLLRASTTENTDLFWAIRGGGGNFGIATAFEFRLHPAGTILGGAVVYPFEQAEQVLRAYREFSKDNPDELTTMAMVMPAPPLPFLPEAAHGKVMVALMVCYNGDLVEGEKVIEPLRHFGTPIVDITGPMPYPAMFQFTQDAAVPGRPSLNRSTFLEEIGDPVIAAIVKFMTAPPSPLAMAQVRVLGGAMARVPVETTAFAHRDKPYMLTIIDSWFDKGEYGLQEMWVEEFWRHVRPHGSGVYVNFLGNEGEARVREAYSEAAHRRLVEVKNRYDPRNVFRFNQNIKPTVA